MTDTLTLQVSRPTVHTIGRTQSYRMRFRVLKGILSSEDEPDALNRYIEDMDEHVFVVNTDEAGIIHLERVATLKDMVDLKPQGSAAPGVLFRANEVDTMFESKDEGEYVAMFVEQLIRDLVDSNKGVIPARDISGGDY